MTVVPRLASRTASPICSSCNSASRTVAWLTLNSRAMCISRSASPGFSVPAKIFSFTISTTCVFSESANGDCSALCNGLSRTNALTPSRNPFPNLVHGWDLGFMVGGGLLVLAAVTMFTMVRVQRDAAVRAVELAVPA